MAESKTNQSARRTETPSAIARPERDSRSGMRRWNAYGGSTSPFEWMDRMTEEMDRLYDQMFRGFGMPRRSWFSGEAMRPWREQAWSPRVEAFQQGDRFIVRADLPGLKKEDVQVELGDDMLMIQGQRRAEHEEEREGYYHSEREYGQFHRAIPLPEGVISESAQASFKDGVLEITMQAAPAETSRGRRLEIKDASEGPQKK